MRSGKTSKWIPVPEEFAVRLEKAVTGGGIVFDNEGKPLSDADVEFCIPWKNRSRTPQICSYRVWVKTDENGKWSFDLLPPEMTGETIHFSVSGKGFMPFETSLPLSVFLPDQDGVFRQSVRMDEGTAVKGRVTDESGKPVSGAVVFSNYMETRNDSVTKTDENGEYKIENLPESQDAYLGVWSEGKMSVIQDFTITKASPPTVDVVMKPAGKPVKIKVIDPKGEPVPKFYIALERWGKHRLVNGIVLHGKEFWGVTDKNGCWVWNEAPDTEIVLDMLIAGGRYMDLRNKTVIARDEEYVFTASDVLKISGHVTDVETGKPVPEFNVFLGIKSKDESEISWTIQPHAGKDGVYSISETFDYWQFCVKIEAEGYKTEISRKIQNKEGTVTIDIPLRKLSAEKLSQTVHGTVFTPDSKPAKEASVVVGLPGFQHCPQIENGKIQFRSDAYLVQTKADGTFRFPYIDFKAERTRTSLPPPETKADDYFLSILHDSGFRIVTQKEYEETDHAKPVTLEKWGRIEGIVKSGTKPAAGVTVQYSPNFSVARSTSELPDSLLFHPHVLWFNTATSDNEGRFSIEKIPPGSGQILQGFSSEDYIDFGNSIDVTAAAGETVHVQIGGTGRPVIGKIPLEDYLDRNRCRISCYSAAWELPEDLLNGVKIPEHFFKETDVNKQLSLIDEWINTTDEGKEYQKMMRRHADWTQLREKSQQFAVVAKEGTFRIDNLTEGDWILEISILSKPQDTGNGQSFVSILGYLTHRFKVDSIPGGVSDEPLDIGMLTPHKSERRKPLIPPGETAPDFEVTQVLPIAEDSPEQKQSDAKLKLSDYEGKYVILDVWATWCVPCIAGMPERKRLYERIRTDPRFVMISISIDNTDAMDKVGRFVAEQQIPWFHGITDSDSPFKKDYNIHVIPAVFLIGPDRKVILSNPSVESLKQKIDEVRKQ
ncbi:MAG: carboxypeptidase regulatory-like domain-containing protein [Planctomycetaceae bacterium]|jgi:thiol-disulfide isomerase/thioredoxin/protocatechuate 3,4-dioxygenase beta subunit|nr:carboxypeptidase regulatory-like domain-containing protein [Planctomycetaceae bacterium]